MRYREFYARITHIDEEQLYIGRLLGTEERFIFRTHHKDDLEAAMARTVEHYLQTHDNKEPLPTGYAQKKILVRCNHDFLKTVGMIASYENISISHWVKGLIEQELEKWPEFTGGTMGD
ncbi:hypothetical protein PT283_08380 [Acetobacteraceae bacterium ESL0697]|nr:hypothetical protein [Acetobacteraceae bacterium ESL0697]